MLLPFLFTVGASVGVTPVEIPVYSGGVSSAGQTAVISLPAGLPYTATIEVEPPADFSGVSSAGQTAAISLPAGLPYTATIERV